jgi:hypothetical protein
MIPSNRLASPGFSQVQGNSSHKAKVRPLQKKINAFREGLSADQDIISGSGS